jgi:hypothetical protein
MVNQTWAKMDGSGLFIKIHIPKLELSQSGDYGGSRAITTIEHADELGIWPIVSKRTRSAIEADHTPGTTYTHVVHGLLAANDQYFVH